MLCTKSNSHSKMLLFLLLEKTGNEIVFRSRSYNVFATPVILFQPPCLACVSSLGISGLVARLSDQKEKTDAYSEDSGMVISYFIRRSRDTAEETPVT